MAGTSLKLMINKDDDISVVMVVKTETMSVAQFLNKVVEHYYPLNSAQMKSYGVFKLTHVDPDFNKPVALLNWDQLGEVKAAEVHLKYFPMNVGSNVAPNNFGSDGTVFL